MKKKSCSLLVLLLASVLAHLPMAFAQVPASGELFNFAELDAAALKTENGASVKVEDDGGEKVVKVTYPESSGYPGVDFKSEAGPWDLSAFGGVEVEVVNNNSIKIGVSVRVDNPGDWKQSPWNTEVLWLDAGASGTVTVNFGRSHGKPGFSLDAGRVSNIKVFVNTPKEGGDLIVRSLRAVGTPATSGVSQPAAGSWVLNGAASAIDPKPL